MRYILLSIFITTLILTPTFAEVASKRRETSFHDLSQTILLLKQEE